MIGGVDVVFWVPDDVPVADVILRTVREYWPEFVFQNGDEKRPLSRSESSMLPRPLGRQFFLYRDPLSAQSWLKHGAVASNANSMIHVILGTRRQPGTGFRSLTVVCDNLTGEMAKLIEALQTALNDLVCAAPFFDQEAAA